MPYCEYNWDIDTQGCQDIKPHTCSIATLTPKLPPDTRARHHVQRVQRFNNSHTRLQAKTEG
jgi:hypothetical protein